MSTPIATLLNLASLSALASGRAPRSGETLRDGDPGAAGKLEEYKRLARQRWPGELKTNRDCNIRNYRLPEGQTQFSIRVHGTDFKADMA